jgi:hypothetical protein
LTIGSFIRLTCRDDRVVANGVYERRGTPLQVHAVGHIERLTPSWITVAGLSCSLSGSRASVTAYRLSEPAVISCNAGGVLASIARSPSRYWEFNFSLGNRPEQTAQQFAARLTLMSTCRRAGERLVSCLRRGNP